MKESMDRGIWQSEDGEVALRRFCREDMSLLYEKMNCREVLKNFRPSFAYPLDGKVFCNFFNEALASRLPQDLIVEYCGMLAGSISWRYETGRVDRVEFCYGWIAPEFRKHRIMSRVFTLLIDYVFALYPRCLIYGHCLADNNPSIKNLINFGFIRTPESEWVSRNGVLTELCCYELSREAYRKNLSESVLYQKIS